jgi:hypothetical protein
MEGYVVNTKLYDFMTFGLVEEMRHLHSVQIFQTTDFIESTFLTQMDIHEEEPVTDTKPAVNLKEVGHRSRSHITYVSCCRFIQRYPHVFHPSIIILDSRS